MSVSVSKADAIAIVATMDTKSAEVDFVSNIIRQCGRDVVRIDVGTSSSFPDRSNDPASLLKSIAQRARVSIGEMQADGSITAVIGIAGGKGSGLFGEVVADLPYGFPKLLVSSARPALLAELAKTSDILLYPTLVDLFGVNGFTSRILTNAAHAIASLRYAPQKDARRSIVAISAFGVTTPAVDRCVRLLADRNIEAVVFPANGSGGRKMEVLIEDGEFDAVLDLTTTELADELLGGTASAGDRRLTAAGLMGIPQLIAPGAVDMVNFGVPTSVPERYAHRSFYSHTPYTTLMRTTPEETREIGRRTGLKLRSASGPVCVMWPEKGVSDYDRENGVFHDPAANEAWLSGVEDTLPETAKCIKIPFHINDPEFADAAVAWILEKIKSEVVADENV
ncbi:Tm-1-like ATP-binding domain-containing protein [Shinella zoogloeoides]|uniref:Tm-1-like ATP-binding domain-containing protein n=1 Tax=Shinella zoogloeoides TaxID=352475 RepID=UPI000E65695B|nr:Tm-1-like ATP-binding domain-containing protein [Shinella zoogloeoides]